MRLFGNFKQYFLNKMARKGWYQKEPKNYAAGKTSRLTADWPTVITSPSTILRYSLRALRVRSRDLCINNDYAKGFLWLVAKNVAGPDGIKVQSKAKLPDGALDKGANDKIEAAWEEFCQKGNFEVTGKFGAVDADRLFAQTVARDGEVIVRFVEGYNNPWQFSLQFFEADYLDETLNVAKLPNGNSIRMSVEFDPWMRPVAYHMLTQHPGDNIWSWSTRFYERIPADQILHAFIAERINQPRGVPWMHSAMTRLNNIGAYEEAEIIGARIGASTMGIWEPDQFAQMAGAPGQDATDETGAPIFEMEPGVFVKAPYGYKFKPFDPQRPTGNFPSFMKATLRGIATGLTVSYNSLASDLESVNYSSLRAGSLEERDMWRILQAWMIDNYKREVFRRWLRMSLLSQAIKLPASKFDLLHKPKFVPRSWPWVDPVKDMEANVLALNNLLTTRSDLAAEHGEDFEEILIKLQEEKILMQKYGVEPIVTQITPGKTGQGEGNSPSSPPGDGGQAQALEDVAI